MKIAVTGSNGRVGKRVVAHALKEGHEVVGIDIADAPSDLLEERDHPQFKYISADLSDYDTTLKVLEGAEGIVQLAALAGPEDYVVKTHNTNVVISWNVLRAAAHLGITRIAQASSVNIVTMVFSVENVFYYLPLDEDHPLEPDEPYGLSKLIMEMQASTIVRRHPELRIASLRLSWSIPHRSVGVRGDSDTDRQKKDLWGYVQEDCAAEAFIRAVVTDDLPWKGHEAFFIAAPDTLQDRDTMHLHQAHYAHVPIKEGKDLSGRKGFFDCSKAERLLGWTHAPSTGPIQPAASEPAPEPASEPKSETAPANEVASEPASETAPEPAPVSEPVKVD